MRLEEELQFMSDFYPSLFPTRKHALDHLFCVIGNGYEWVNGELVGDSDYKRRYSLAQKIEKAEFRDEKRWNDMNKLMIEIGDDSKLNCKFAFKWYPLCYEYSYLINYPDDIKEDWLNAINETKDLLIKDGIYFGK